MDHDISDEQLDVLLKQRAVPEMRSNLAHRIIDASRDVPQQKTGLARFGAFGKDAGGALLKGVASILDHVALPQPAFAMAAVVVMIGGMVLGAQTGGLSTLTLSSNAEYTSTYDSSDVEAYIMATDSFEYGDFL